MLFSAILLSFRSIQPAFVGIRRQLRSRDRLSDVILALDAIVSISKYNRDIFYEIAQSLSRAAGLSLPKLWLRSSSPT